MSAFETIIENFLYFAIGIGAIIAGTTVFADVFSRKNKKEEYLAELEALEKIHAVKKVSENAKEEKQEHS